MINGRKFFCIMILLISISLLLCIPCVYSYWVYGEQIVESQERVFNIKYFPWTGEGIIPDDGDDSDDNTSQIEGLQVIIDALNNDGLSTGSKSKLNQYIDKRVKNFNKLEYGSVDVKEDVVSLLDDITDIHPDFYFILSGHIVGSGKNKYVDYFDIYMVNMTEYNSALEAWDNSGLSESNYEDDPSIFNEYFYPVYKVRIEKDAYDRWQPTIGEEGYTGFGYYEGSNNGGGQKVWTFDPGTWVAGMPS